MHPSLESLQNNFHSSVFSEYLNLDHIGNAMFRDEVSAQVRISPLPPRDLKPLASSDSTQWL